MLMFRPTQIMIEELVANLREAYRRTYGQSEPTHEGVLGWVAGMALETIATSDALYHDVEHTMLVTLVGQEILHGKHIREGGVSPDDWLHFIVAQLCHDIGYVRGICRGDKGNVCATGVGDELVELAPGATDASLTPYHVDRGKLFVRERFGPSKYLDAEQVAANIELTRFPVPAAEDHQATTDYPGLVRAADLIGQLSDPRYLNKIPALFYEFEETGTNAKLGYEHPGDLRRNYPKFYWSQVYPYIKDALPYLQVTLAGKMIVSNLYANVFVVEHENSDEIGPR
jgi:hypothetical protein